MAELLDGQLSQNNGNWQWVAGTGADAQPFHRIFSPLRQTASPSVCSTHPRSSSACP
jgi:deoxyribodipyrimidine photolyase